MTELEARVMRINKKIQGLHAILDDFENDLGLLFERKDSEILGISNRDALPTPQESQELTEIMEQSNDA